MKRLIRRLIPSFLLDGYHLALSLLGAFLYRFPSRRLTVIGVTGTNGKSTVIHLIAKIFEEAGFRTASFSSIEWRVGERSRANTMKMTMPGRLRLQKFLRESVSAGCRYAVLEVTSEGIKQHRHRHIDFDVAVFTNLTPEHIESHGSFEKYRRAKGELFRAVKGIHVVNLDDPNAEYFLQFFAQKKFGYRVEGGRIFIDNIPLSVNLKLPGEFNLYNAAAAVAAGLSQKISLPVCKRAVEKVETVPGRMETVATDPFTVIIDYAHTPDALEKVYRAVKGRKICVFGSCGGGRDKWKRPELGRIASEHCDKIILTNEDPYDEPPEKILEDIAGGAPGAEKILDRKKAIKKALSLAGPGDTVLITGKGSEPCICAARGKKIPWNEKEVVKSLI